jgi:hypothetical protein
VGAHVDVTAAPPADGRPAVASSVVAAPSAPSGTEARKKGNCGCAANDLLCAMKCSAGGK